MRKLELCVNGIFKEEREDKARAAGTLAKDKDRRRAETKAKAKAEKKAAKRAAKLAKRTKGRG